MMKLLRVTSATLLIAFACGVVVFAIPQTEKDIQSIRQAYAATNRKLARYRKVKKELSGFSTEGGELLAYFDGDAIVRINTNYLGESGRAYEEYYFRDGKLIFVFRKDSNYDRPLSGKVVSTKMNRFYFRDDHLIRWVDENGKQVAAGTGEYGVKEQDYLKFAQQLGDGARAKGSTVEN